MPRNSRSVHPSSLVELRREAQRRYADDDFNDAWVDSIRTLIRERWASATDRQAEILIDIMAATPSATWMREYLLPAEAGTIEHADVLVRRFDAVASAFAEGVAREDGLTTPA
jgi:hypothetical protein